MTYQEIYRDEWMIISSHNGREVAVQVGDPPEASTPTIVDAVDLLDALSDYLHQIDADSGREHNEDHG